MTKGTKKPAKGSKAPKKKQNATRSVAVSAPVARMTSERASAPKISNPRDGAVRVARREFVGTTTNGSATDFTLDANSAASPGWDFNPGVSAIFPWLSYMASSYERYRFHSLSFELVSSQPTSTAGRVYAAVDYDWDDEVPTTKQQLMGNLTAQEAPVWSNLRIVCDPRQLSRDMPFKYVNTAGRVVYSEPRTAYAGFLMIGFDTPTANCKFDIFVSYDIELEVPVVENMGAMLTNPTPTPAAPYVTSRSPFYQALTGGLYHVGANWVQNQFKGKIREVIGGLGDVPQLATAVEGLLERGLDLGRLSNLYRVTLEGALKASTVTPASWITTGKSTVHGLVYDAQGTTLGSLRNYDGTAKESLSCADDGCLAAPAELNTANKFAQPILSFSMEGLRKVYPTARYVIPYLLILAALSVDGVPGYSGIDYRIW